jgi:processing peptidase subunit beta
LLKQAQITKLGNNSYENQMLDQLHGTAFQGNALGNALEGSAQSVAAVSVDDLAVLLAKVKGEDVVVVGTGGGSHEKLVEATEKALGGLKSEGSKEVGSVAEKAYFMGSDIRIRYDSHKTATIALGFEGASWTDAKSMPLALMTTLLGSYTTSSGIGKNVAATMCQEVSDIASSISAYNLSYSDTGLFGMVATAPDNMLDDLMWNVMPNFVRLAHGVSEEELARAKLALKTQLLSSMDGEIVAGQEMARQLQTIGRVMPLVEVLARVDALTMDDVKAAANEVINDQDHALAAIGGIHELPDYNWIRRKSYMLRY